MDKITQYQQILSDLLAEFASYKKTLTPGIQSYALVDKDKQHYQLLSIGWHNDQYVYTVAFHFAIIGKKIWIQQNNTDIMIAQELMEHGVPKSDIVLGFVPEKARSFSGYAVA